MQPINRVQENIVARHERRFLNWACAWMPEGVTSDHLTVLSVVGALTVLGGYVGSRADPRFLLVAVLGYLLNWFGDSLDGSLARYRKVTRPRYGYFLDHSVDALSTLLMIGGMGLSPYLRTDVALFAVVGYLALCIHVFLRNYVTGTFQLTFMYLGPTELRMAFVGMTLFMLAGGSTHWAGVAILSDCDIILLVIGSIFFFLFGSSTLAMAAELRALDGDQPLPNAAVQRSPWCDPALDGSGKRARP